MTFEGVIYRVKLGFLNRVIYWCGRIGAWALIEQLDMMGYPRRIDRATLRSLVEKDIAGIRPRIAALLVNTVGLS